MTTQDVDTAPEPPPGTPILRKKAYHPPSLVDWGTLLELTGGPAVDVQDGDFQGSGHI
jgi:hypothetical protein